MAFLSALAFLSGFVCVGCLHYSAQEAVATTPNDWRQCQDVGECRDQRSDCADLADKGTCYSDPEYMDSNCRKTCGGCFTKEVSARTACRANSTCCEHSFSNTGIGCCPFENAVCCNRFTCCPAGTRCQDESHGESYRVVTRCVDIQTREEKAPGKTICKPGPDQPMSKTKKNCIIIGDSVSVGYTPALETMLRGECKVQHSPFSTGPGVGDAAYGLDCLENFIRSSDGEDIMPKVDVLFFNWGLHNLVIPPQTVVPGVASPPEEYLPALTSIVKTLTGAREKYGTKLLYGLTSPQMCDPPRNDIILRLNKEAMKLMHEYKVPTVDMHTPIVKKCGAPPQDTCLGLKHGGCPHYNPDGYEWLASEILAPAFRDLLGASANRSTQP